MRDYCKSSITKGMIAAVITLAVLVFSTAAAVLVIKDSNSYSPAIIDCFGIWVASLIIAILSSIPVTVLTVFGIVHGAIAIKKEGKKEAAAFALNTTVYCISRLLGLALLFTHMIVISMRF